MYLKAIMHYAQPAPRVDVIFGKIESGHKLLSTNILQKSEKTLQ